MNARLALAAMLVAFIAACSGGSTATSSPTSSTTAGSSAAPSAPASAGGSPGSRIDWKTVDACTLADAQTVQVLTGETVKFVAQGRKDVSGSSCFWGAAVPGVGAYVELSFVNGYAGGLSNVGFTSEGVRCTADVPVKGVGTEARGGSCTPVSQRKVYLYALFQGGAGELLVNASKRSLQPADLAAAVNAALAKLK